MHVALISKRNSDKVQIGKPCEKTPRNYKILFRNAISFFEQEINYDVTSLNVFHNLDSVQRDDDLPTSVINLFK